MAEFAWMTAQRVISFSEKLQTVFNGRIGRASAVVSPCRIGIGAVGLANTVMPSTSAQPTSQASINRSERGVHGQTGLGQKLIDRDQDEALAEPAAAVVNAD